MCSAWLATVFGEITNPSAISLLESPRASSLRTSTSRVVRPAGPSRRRGTRWPAAPSTAPTAPGAWRAALDVGPKLDRGLLGGASRAVGTGLAHRLVRVRGSEDARLARDPSAAEPVRVAGAVEALPVLHGDPG